MSWRELSWDCLPPALQNAIYILLKKLDIPFKKEEIQYIKLWTFDGEKEIKVDNRKYRYDTGTLIEVNGLFYGIIYEDFKNYLAYSFDWGKQPTVCKGYTNIKTPKKEFKKLSTILEMVDTNILKYTPIGIFYGTVFYNTIIMEICKKLPEWLKGIETSEGTIIEVEVISSELIYCKTTNSDIPVELRIQIEGNIINIETDIQMSKKEFKDTMKFLEEEIPINVTIY